MNKYIYNTKNKHVLAIVEADTEQKIDDRIADLELLTGMDKDISNDCQDLIVTTKTEHYVVFDSAEEYMVHMVDMHRKTTGDHWRNLVRGY